MDSQRRKAKEKIRKMMKIRVLKKKKEGQVKEVSQKNQCQKILKGDLHQKINIKFEKQGQCIKLFKKDNTFLIGEQVRVERSILKI